MTWHTINIGMLPFSKAASQARVLNVTAHMSVFLHTVTLTHYLALEVYCSPLILNGEQAQL